MHLISALAAGIRGAEGGTVDIYRRDTSTRVTLYTSFEGDGATVPTTSSALDSDGALVVYVAEVVDVVVKDSGGATVRSFTDGVSADCVEYIGPSFTGKAYGGGKSGVNLPITVADLLDLWAASSGSTDFEVGSGGEPLEDAIVGLTGVLYNVKSYGAMGDGVTNDAAAITSAISAAAAAGGGTVFFPPGTYLCGSSVSQNALTPFRGAGSDVSKLRLSAAGASVTWRALIEDLTVDSSVNLSGRLLNPAVGANPLRLSRCTLGNSTFSVPACINNGPTMVVAIDACTFNIIGATQKAIDDSGSTWSGVISNCQIVVHAVTHTGILVDLTEPQITFNAVSVTYLTTTTGPSTVFDILQTGTSFMSVNALSLIFFSGSPTTTVFDFGASGNMAFVDSGSNLPGLAGTLYDLSGASIGASRMDLGIRRSRLIQYTNDTAAITIDSLSYELVEIQRTTNGAQTVTFTKAPQGARLSVRYWNNHAGAGGTITFDTTNVDMVAASNQFSIAANSYRLFHFISLYTDASGSGDVRWCEIEMAAADEPE